MYPLRRLWRLHEASERTRQVRQCKQAQLGIRGGHKQQGRGQQVRLRRVQRVVHCQLCACIINPQPCSNRTFLHSASDVNGLTYAQILAHVVTQRQIMAVTSVICEILLHIRDRGVIVRASAHVRVHREKGLTQHEVISIVHC